MKKIKKIEKLGYVLFELIGYDPIDTALFRVEKVLDIYTNKINELIEQNSELVDKVNYLLDNQKK